MRNRIFSLRRNRTTLFLAGLVTVVSLVSLTTLAQKSPESQSPAANAAGGGNITVRVMGDGRPLPDARVHLIKSGAKTIPDTRVVTDENGEYVFRNLLPGFYTVVAGYNGYTSIGETILNGPPRGGSYKPGDSVVFNLTKGGAITGRVTDQSGEPLVMMSVGAVRVINSQGRRAAAGGSTAETDDRGIYRIYGLPAGSYIVSVTGKPLGARGNTNPYYDSLPTYYPATNRENAKEVAVTLGGEASGIDITFGPVAGHSISGRIASALPGNVSVRLSQIDFAGAGVVVSVRPDSNDHSFQFTSVEDGEYEITATYFQDSGPASRGRSPRFKVKGSDVTGINLALVPAASLAGRMVFENPVAASSETCQKKTATPFAEITALARNDNRTDALYGSSFGRTVGDNGDFVIPDIDAGHYLMGARFPNDDVYVASISNSAGRPVGMRSVASKGLTDLSNLITVGTGERTSGIVIKLANGAAGIGGRVTSADVPVSSGAFRLFLLPMDRELVNDPTRYYEGAIGSEGKFLVNNLAPGKYWLMALPIQKNGETPSDFIRLIFDNSFRDAIRKQAETSGTQIDLKPCQRVADFSLKIQ